MITVIARVTVAFSLRGPAVEVISTTRVIVCSFAGAVTLNRNWPEAFPLRVCGDAGRGVPPVTSGPVIQNRIVKFPFDSAAGPPLAFRKNIELAPGASAVAPPRTPVTGVCPAARGAPARTTATTSVSSVAARTVRFTATASGAS